MNAKYAFISGASRGIGAATARKLAAEGYHLFLNCKSSLHLLQTLKKELEEAYHIQCFLCMGDVSDPASCSQMFELIAQHCPSLDVLVHNAGISLSGLLTDLSVNDWHQIIDTNLSSAFYLSRLAVPGMVARKSGSIVFVSSIWGNNGASCEVAYSASKGGLNSFTKALAKELAPSNIRVNALACGLIDTAMNACYTADELRALCEEIPSGRMGTPEEIALAISLLLQAPSYQTGQIIAIDGGWI